MINVQEIRQKAIRASLILHTLGDTNNGDTIPDQLNTVNKLLHEIYMIATEASD